MGKGNVSVSGPYEGLYYIDQDFYRVWRADDINGDEYESRLYGELSTDEIMSSTWYEDEEGTIEELCYIEDSITEAFCKRFPAFENRIDEPAQWIRTGAYGSYDRRVLAESKLFYLCTEDNECSQAIELIQKECWYDDHLSGPQKRHYQTYLDGLRDIMLKLLPSIGTYGGPWTSGTLKLEEVAGNA